MQCICCHPGVQFGWYSFVPFLLKPNLQRNDNEFVNQTHNRHSGNTERQLPAIPKGNGERVDIPDISGYKSQAGHPSRNENNASNAVQNKVIIDFSVFKVAVLV